MYSARAPRTSRHFYPRPPRGGRQRWQCVSVDGFGFLSTPSARRATPRLYRSTANTGYFYPRPPRGGRHQTTLTAEMYRKFLSTPSARRATPAPVFRLLRLLFLSTPSARRATRMELEAYGHSKISIHALREEGDYKSVPNLSQAWIFLSTPSARRATPARARLQLPAQISIHALREEGDG